ncbi:MAG: T9SS type A sorting domain-containing protein [Bacteroidota bacterium]|jgi:pectate lyase|nr:T9SS type A sorting domain-containing protein [Prolixibacteraceae bacterium]MDI9565095.1 T9SS type A sorting domain-containing protein [Bacteroidota bacterium]
MTKQLKSFLFILMFEAAAFISGAQQLAFPGAEGYGRFASGGRGNGQTGRVVEVTNLEDDLDHPPEGSLRWAFSQGIEVVVDPILGNISVKRPLTVVFRVGGVINLKGELRVNRSNMTIAGQTAPGDGICIRGATVNLGGSKNLIVRHLRFRPGDELGQETSALRIENGGNFIIDHCSMSWAIEETTHFSSNKNITVQWCIISESLYNSLHKKGARGYATQWGGEYASYHHNLLAHHNSRMPRINGSNSNDLEALVDYRNNVNFNWASSGAFYGGEWEGTAGKGFCHTNVVNNYFIPGPATPSSLYFARPSYNRSGIQVDGYGKWYVTGNIMEGSEAKTNDNWLGVDGSSVGGIANIRSETMFVKSDGLLEEYARYTETAAVAYLSVLRSAGAILPVRDTIDRRVIAEAAGEVPVVRYFYTTNDGQVTPDKGVPSGIIDTPVNLVPEDQRETRTAWDVYATSYDAPADTDHDGIPDEWEISHGLNPEDITDGRIIASNGYSNLENYLNRQDHITGATAAKRTELFRLYPNPADDRVFIESDDTILRIEIGDFSGRIIFSCYHSIGVDGFQTGHLKPGIYLVKGYSATNRLCYQKLIKR